MINPSTLPRRLQTIASPPKSLYVRGEDIHTLLKRPCVAIVGARAASPYGRHVTKTLGEELARMGVVIVSGLALGIDSIAHEAALSVKGKTIAVVPGGIERIYPRSHEVLARRIINGGGCVLSEHSGTFTPAKHDFLIRNRLVAGLADAVIVTEAAERSGTLNTVGHALEQGKTVGAVPGNITNPMSTGTNQLLKAGAIPITSAADVIDALNCQERIIPLEQTALFEGTEEETLLMTLMRQGMTSGEELCIKSGLSSERCSFALTMLELHGYIRAGGNNTWLIK